jgi:hypothetical protein
VKWETLISVRKVLGRGAVKGDSTFSGFIGVEIAICDKTGTFRSLNSCNTYNRLHIAVKIARAT